MRIGPDSFCKPIRTAAMLGKSSSSSASALPRGRRCAPRRQSPLARSGAQDRIGSIEAGKAADLLLFDGDPLTDIAQLQDPARITLVIKGGKPVAGTLYRPAGGSTPARGLVSRVSVKDVKRMTVDPVRLHQDAI